LADLAYWDGEDEGLGLARADCAQRRRPCGDAVVDDDGHAPLRLRTRSLAEVETSASLDLRKLASADGLKFGFADARHRDYILIANDDRGPAVGDARLAFRDLDFRYNKRSRPTKQ